MMNGEDEDEPIVVTRTAKIQLGPFLYANNNSDHHYELKPAINRS